MKYVSFEEARTLVLENVSVMPPQNVRLTAAAGRTAAVTIQAAMNVPEWSYSALDGFALRADAIKEASADHPVKLQVSGHIMAGQAARLTVAPGAAVRIMTGAPVPAGADCVVGFEDCRSQATPRGRQKTVEILKTVRSGQNIRPAGEQIRQGSLLLADGRTIGPGEVNLLASLGTRMVSVIRRPEIAIISSGEELVAAGYPLKEAGIYCGNSSAIAAQVLLCGGVPVELGIARDRRSSILKKLKRGLAFDMILTTGGSSGGDRDLVKEIMHEMGDVIFDQVDMKPGKTTALAMLEPFDMGKRIPHIALSGTPSAAMLGFEVFARPAILKMQGRVNGLKPVIGVAARVFTNPGGRTRLVWVTLGRAAGSLQALPSESGNSGVLASIAAAGGIAVIPSGVDRISLGSPIPVIPLDWHQEQSPCIGDSVVHRQ